MGPAENLARHFVEHTFAHPDPCVFRMGRRLVRGRDGGARELIRRDAAARGGLLGEPLPARCEQTEARDQAVPKGHAPAQNTKSMPTRAPNVFLTKPEPTAPLMFHLPSSDQRETRAAAATWPP